MTGLRVGVEIQAPADVVAQAVATLPWMLPETIALDEHRVLLVLATGFEQGADACTYTIRRINKSADGLGLELKILSAESYPPVIDLRERTSPEQSWTEPGSFF